MGGSSGHFRRALIARDATAAAAAYALETVQVHPLGLACAAARDLITLPIPAKRFASLPFGVQWDSDFEIGCVVGGE